MTPQRIQLSRKKGWRLPPGAVVVARPTKWGNPYRIERIPRGHELREEGFGWFIDNGMEVVTCATRQEAAEAAVQTFHLDWLWVLGRYPIEKLNDTEPTWLWCWPLRDELPELRGRDLACWCPLVDANGNRVPCHADVLLDIANGEADG